MNLVRQFPDISEKIRSKKETGNRTYRSANAKQSLGYIEDEGVAQYFEGEFKRWHMKFLYIVTATSGTIYIIIFKSLWIYNLIN